MKFVRIGLQVLTGNVALDAIEHTIILFDAASSSGDKQAPVPSEFNGVLVKELMAQILRSLVL